MNSIFIALVLIAADPTYPEIMKQVDLLSHDEFDERQLATKKLIEMGEPASRVLLKINIKDKEVIARKATILTAFIDNFRPRKSDTLPWLDCLPENYPDREKVINDCMLYDHWRLDISSFKKMSDLLEGQGVFQGGGAFTGYRWGTQIFILELMKTKKTKKEILDLLDEMKETERKWIARGGRYKMYDPYKEHSPEINPE